jgi:hypothetical protein
MQNILELFVIGKNDTIGQIDLYGDEPISLTMAISDIVDISKRNSTYSQNFTIPANKNNNILLNHIFNIGSDSSFDPSKKTRCYMNNDYITIFQGSFQLIKINVKNANVISYECVVYGDVIDLAKSLGTSLLTDLNYIQLDHICNPTNIMASWTAKTKDLGYYYPLIDYGYDLTKTTLNNGLDVSYFRPAVSNKYLFDKVINEIGFSYTSDFINSDIFSETIIPFNGISVNNPLTADQIKPLAFQASTTFSKTSQGAYVPTSSCFLNDSTGGNFNIYSAFNTTTGKYTCPFNAAMSFSFYTECVYNGPTPPSNTILVKFFRSSYMGGAAEFYQEQPQIVNGLNKITVTSPMLEDELSSSLYPVLQGETIFMSFAGTGSPTYNVVFNAQKTTFYNTPKPIEVLGGPLQFLNYIPKNVKQIDYLKSIIIMFNLLVIPSKDNFRHLTFIPRQDYLAAGTIKDWSNKVDHTFKIDETLLSEQQNKTNLFTYKVDLDYYNVDYTKKTKTTFGEYKLILDNEWIEGIKTTEVIFSPTPIDKVINTQDVFCAKIATFINNVYGKTEHNIRFLRKNLTPMNTVENIKYFNNAPVNYYPYAGHLDSPIINNVDYNFGRIIYSFYDELNSLTNNNLINTYWKDYLDDIANKNSKLVKCNIYLTPNDIAQFNFNDSIFIAGLTDDGGHYFIVNKIIYIPTRNIPSVVELIKVNKKPSDYITPITLEQPLDIPFLQLEPLNTINLGGPNAISAPQVMVIGKKNIITPNGYQSLVVGNNNIVNAPNAILLNANNKTIDTPFVTIIGNTYFYPDGTSTAIYNDIDAGEDVVLTPFGTNAYNDIDAGQDEVLGIGSSCPVQDIDECEDEVI